jgi:diguanylate cyclase (GGDEF)-like protein
MILSCKQKPKPDRVPFPDPWYVTPNASDCNSMLGIHAIPGSGSARRARATSKDGPSASRFPSEPVKTVEQLVDLAAQLSQATDLAQILAIVAPAARKLTQADSATVILREEQNSFYAAEDSQQLHWLSKRFPTSQCISGWVMDSRTPVSVFDINKDPRIQSEHYCATSIRSLSMVPIRTHSPLGAIGNYWVTPHHPTQEQIRLLQALADSTAIALEKFRIQQEMETLVRIRTKELEEANQELRKDALLRTKMEAQIIHLSLTDELTGLNNRRGFLLRADQLFKLIHRVQTRAWLVYLDIDNLKQVNDRFGHEAGDRLIRGAAKILRESFRDSDVIGRIGGDEFVVFATGTSTPLGEIHNRLNRNIRHFNSCFPDHPALSLSIGSIRCEPRKSQTLEELIHLADAAMYIEKRSKRIQLSDEASS